MGGEWVGSGWVAAIIGQRRGHYFIVITIHL